MKSILTILLAAFCLSIPSFAQQACFSEEVVQQQIQLDPNYAAELNQMRLMARNSNGGGQRAVRTVSVVVHVVYNSSAANIAQSQINNMITTLNEDFRKLNPDFANTRSAFVPVAADSEIEFCLDRTIRVSSNYSCYSANTQPNTMKSASSGGSNPIDPSSYLNVWIVDICGTSSGGVAGYAYLPTAGMHGSSIDGLVLDYSLGFNGGDGRTATHEIGHYLGLEHPWGNGSCSTAGNGDDGFSDTPTTSGPNYGCSANNSCGTPSPGDMVENFMDYSFCPTMYTTDQANYMNAVLTQIRSSLFSSPGCNSSVPQGPSADFEASVTDGCPGESITFTDLSSGNPTNWNWSFPGGSPSSSNQQNPTVTYNSPGTYAVTLTASNVAGTDTETKNTYITIFASNSLPLQEGFQATTFTPAGGWSLLNPDGDVTWARTNSAGGFGTSSASAFMDNYNYNSQGAQDVIFTPFYDFSSASSPELTFDHAYAQYNTQYEDSLYVIYTTDCGDTYFFNWRNGGPGLATAPSTTSEFVPTANQWQTNTIDLSNLSGQQSVRFGFFALNDYGNNVFIDNINITTNTVSPAPIANFSGTPLTIPVGGQVNFSDLSTNSPTNWSWTFNGGTPTTFNGQTPPAITYNAAGTYQVSLTVTNANGTDTETKPAYVTVVPQTGSGTCDTLTNLTTNQFTVIGAQGGGYASGHNVFGDVSKADIFTGATVGDQIEGALLFFGVAEDGANPTTINVNVWDDNGAAGAPGTVLASEQISIASIAADIAGNGQTYVTFSNPVTITGTFYLGIDFNYNDPADTVALGTTVDGFPVPGTAWEQWGNNGGWFPYSTLAANGGWELNVAHLILPIVCEPGQTAQPPVADFSSNTQNICQGQAVTFSDQSTNTPTSWSWSFQGGNPSSSSQQNPTVSYSNAGAYQVSLTVSNLDGSDTETKTSYVTVNQNPSGSTSSSQALCFGSNTGGITLTVSGGATPYNYQWSNGSNDKDLSNLFAGTYTVTISDANGCSATASTAVTQPTNAISATASSVAADCGQANGSATASGSNGSGSYTYNWSTGANGATASSLSPGTYTVTVSDANGCSTSASTTVGNTGGLTATASGVNITCAGAGNGSVSVAINGGNSPFTYLWNTNQTTATINNAAGGTYTVTVTDASGCVDVASTSIFEPNNLFALLNANDATCGQTNGDASVINITGGTPPYTYVWNTGVSDAPISGVAAGTYTVTLTDANNCTDVSSVTVSAGSRATLSFTSTDVGCAGVNDGTASVSATGGTSPYSYEWSNGETTQNISNLSAGTYVVTLTDGDNCTVAGSAVVNNSGATVDFISTDVCSDAQLGGIDILVSGGQQPYTIDWSNGLPNTSLTGLSADTYTVTVTDGSGCETVTVVDVNRTVVVGLDTINPGPGLSNGRVEAIVTSGTQPVSYIWNTGSTNAVLNNVAAGAYSVTVVDALGCQSTASATIGSVGIVDASELLGFEMFPNPTDGTLNLKYNLPEASTVKVQLFDLMGKQVITQTFDKQLTTDHLILDLAALPGGTYFVKLTAGSNHAIKKVLKTN